MLRTQEAAAVTGGKTVIITGCDSGIGLATVEALAALGVRVVALCLSPAGAERASAAGAVATVLCDLSRGSETVAGAAKSALAAAAAGAGDASSSTSSTTTTTTSIGGGVHAVVLCAGIVAPGFFDFQTMGNFRACMEVNCLSAIELTSVRPRSLLPSVRAAAPRGEATKRMDAAPLLRECVHAAFFPPLLLVAGPGRAAGRHARMKSAPV